MKKITAFGIVIFMGLAGYVGAYDVQPGDNALLTKVYDRIDEKMQDDVDGLVAFYDAMPVIQLQYGNTEKNRYFLTKIHDYLTERLYRATTAPTFSCIAERVQGGDTVTIDYNLTTEEGKKISLTKGQYTLQDTTPLLFNLGKGQVIDGVEESVYGMKSGSTRGVQISYRNAYGGFDDTLVIDLPRLVVEQASSSELAIDQKVSMSIIVDGKTYLKTGYISALGTETVKVNFNKVLAGHDLQGLITVASLFKNCQ